MVETTKLMTSLNMSIGGVSKKGNRKVIDLDDLRKPPICHNFLNAPNVPKKNYLKWKLRRKCVRQPFRKVTTNHGQDSALISLIFPGYIYIHLIETRFYQPWSFWIKYWKMNEHDIYVHTIPPFTQLRMKPRPLTIHHTPSTRIRFLEVPEAKFQLDVVGPQGWC